MDYLCKNDNKTIRISIKHDNKCICNPSYKYFYNEEDLSYINMINKSRNSTEENIYRKKLATLILEREIDDYFCFLLEKMFNFNKIDLKIILLIKNNDVKKIIIKDWSIYKDIKFNKNDISFFMKERSLYNVYINYKGSCIGYIQTKRCNGKNSGLRYNFWICEDEFEKIFGKKDLIIKDINI